MADVPEPVPEEALDPLDSAYAFVLEAWQGYRAWWHQERDQAEVLHGYPVVSIGQFWDELAGALKSLWAYWS